MRFVIAVALAGSLAACSLLTSFDDLSRGAPIEVTDHDAAADVPHAEVEGGPTTDGAMVPSRPATIFVGPGSDSAGIDQRETFYATVQEDGSLGEWKSGPLLPVAHSRGAMATDGESIYFLGGYANGTTAKDVLRCHIVGDHFSDWSLEQPLPSAVARERAYARGGSLVVLGGLTTSAIADVSQAPIGTTLGMWDAATPLLMPLAGGAFAMGLGGGAAVYLVGGQQGGAATDHVYVGTFDDAGAIATWQSSPPFAWVIEEGAAAATPTHLYVNGGYVGDPRRVRVAAIHGDGTLGGWSETNPVTVPRTGHALIYASGHIYAIAGTDGSQAVASVEVADLVAGGALTTFRSTRPLPLARQFVSAVVVVLPE